VPSLISLEERWRQQWDMMVGMGHGTGLAVKLMTCLLDPRLDLQVPQGPEGKALQEPFWRLHTCLCCLLQLLAQPSNLLAADVKGSGLRALQNFFNSLFNSLAQCSRAAAGGDGSTAAWAR